MSSYTRMRPRTGPRTGQEPKTSQHYGYIPVLGGSVIQFTSGSLLVLWPVIYAYNQQRSNRETPSSSSGLGRNFKSQIIGEELAILSWKPAVFLGFLNTQNYTILRLLMVSQIPRTAAGSLILMFFKYPCTADSLILIFEIPRTDWFFFCFFSNTRKWWFFLLKKPNNHPTLVHTSSRTGQRTGQEPIQKKILA